MVLKGKNVDQVLKEDRKSLAMTVEIKVGPEYEHVDDTDMDMDMDMYGYDGSSRRTQ